MGACMHYARACMWHAMYIIKGMNLFLLSEVVYLRHRYMHCIKYAAKNILHDIKFFLYNRDNTQDISACSEQMINCMTFQAPSIAGYFQCLKNN